MSCFGKVTLGEVGHARAGDKGNRLNIAPICRHPDMFAQRGEQVTADFGARLFATRRPTLVTRFDLPNLAAFNVCLEDVLEGGVNASLGLDGHGRSLSFLLLGASVSMPIQDRLPTPANHELLFRQ